MSLQPVFWMKIQLIESPGIENPGLSDWKSESAYARRTKRRRAMPATPTSPVPSSSMLAGSGTSMLESRSAAAGSTATGVAEAATGLRLNRGGADGVRLARECRRARDEADTSYDQRTRNERTTDADSFWLTQPSPGPTRFAASHSKVHTVQWSLTRGSGD